MSAIKWVWLGAKCTYCGAPIRDAVGSYSKKARSGGSSDAHMTVAEYLEVRRAHPARQAPHQDAAQGKGRALRAGRGH